MVKTKNDFFEPKMVGNLCVRLFQVIPVASYIMTSMLLMVQGEDITTIFATTTDAMANVVFTKVKLQKVVYRWQVCQMADLSMFSSRRTVTAIEQFPAVNT